MADPLSVAGLAAGLVSLSLQVTSGITEYLDALKCRAEELDSVRKHNESLRASIIVIQSSVTKAQPHHQASSQIVIDAIKYCECEIKSLEDLVAELTGYDSGTWRQRVQLKGKKLRYMFDRPKVQHLTDRLAQANRTVGTALQVLGIDVTQSTFDRLAGIETISRDISTNLLATRSEVVISSRQQQTQLKHLTGQNARQDQQIQDIAHTLQGLARHLGINDDIGLRRPETQERTFHRLLEKPSKTREICDDLGGRDKWRAPPGPASGAQLARATSPGDSSIYPICICNKTKHRTSSLSVKTTGPFVWRNEKMHHGHWPSCPLAGIVATGEQRRVLGVRYNGLAWILKSAVEVSFASSHGAGGWSLCPHISFRPTVDERIDPVFRILGLFKVVASALLHEKEQGICTKGRVEFFAQCQTRIFQLFREKRSTNLATNSKNQSMAHILADATYIFRMNQYLRNSTCTGPDDDFLGIWQVLISVGVPANTYDVEGRSPLGILLGSPNFEYPERSLVLQADTEHGPAPPGSWAEWNDHKLIELMDHIPSLPQRFECGPLSLAVISGDLEQVTDLLDRFPKALNERNLLGHTPFHLAANKPDSLTILAKATPRSSEILNLRDNYSRTPLDLAMSLSGGICRSRNFYRKCRGCGCARSVAVLLKADCAVPQPDLGFLHCSILRTSSNRAVRRYARHMADRRSRLRQLGTDHSSILASEGFVVDTAEMLDNRAEEMSRILIKHNIHIPNPLRLLRSEIPYYNGSIYQSLRRPWQADLFWRLLFRDLNSANLEWKSPPLITAFTGTISSLDYIEWLLEHGADPFQPFQTQKICKGRSRATDEAERTCAHAMMFRIGDTIRFERWDTEKADIEYLKGLQALNTRFLHLGLPDACACACSFKGCTLQVYQLKGLLDFHRGCITPRSPLADGLTDPAHLSREVAQYYEQFAMTLSKSCHRDTIRFLTFSALGATHTCCFFNTWESCYTVSLEDIQDVQDEEKAILERLEQLVLHFEAELFAILEKWPDRPERIAGFWIGFWLPKMQQVLLEDDESGLSEEARQRAEDAGVVWHKSNSSSNSSAITVYDKRVWGQMSKILDDITFGN